MTTRARHGRVEFEAVLDQVLWCWLCGGARVFVPPGCDDCHGDPKDGADCPERLCADCGSAVLVGAPPLEPAEEAPDDQSRQSA